MVKTSGGDAATLVERRCPELTLNPVVVHAAPG
jgi:hypothetical protein